MTEQKYRKHPAISRSELYKLTESPQKFKYYKEHPIEPTPALIFGQVLHKLALQPKTFGKEFVILPEEINARTKDGKEQIRAIKAQAMMHKQTVISQSDFDKADEMCKALYSDKFAKKLLSGRKEHPFFWVDEETGEQCKCRADCVKTIKGMPPIIIDLKTTTCADTETFSREAVKYGYPLQAAMYKRGIDACTGKNHIFVFVAIEKEPPYAVNIMQADDMFIRYGDDLFRHLMKVYHECKTKNNWYGYMGVNHTVNSLYLPSYIK